METQILQLIIQGGAVGISLVALWIIYKLSTNHSKHLSDALDRNSESWVKNAEALGKLTEKLHDK